MLKKILLLLFSLLTSIYTFNIHYLNFSKPFETAYKCPSYDIPTSNICELTIQALRDDYKTKLLLDYCGSSKKCSTTCQNLPKFRKIGKRCEYTEECLRGKCIDNKCIVANKDEVCTDIGDCEEGFYCDGIVCKKYRKELESCDNENLCGLGLSCSVENICVRWGTGELGEACNDDKFCASGICSKKCVEFSHIVSNCELDNQEYNAIVAYKDDSQETIKCVNVVKEGKGTFYIPTRSKMRSILWGKYLKKFNKIEDLNKFYEEKYAYDIAEGFGNKNLKERYIQYYYAEQLSELDFIDAKGEVDKNFECEYDWLYKNYLSAGRMKGWILGFLLWLLMLC